MVVLYSSNASAVEEVKSKRVLHPTLIELKALVRDGKIEVFSKGGDGVLWQQGRLGVPTVGGLNYFIFQEAHNSSYYIHPNSKKIY